MQATPARGSFRQSYNFYLPFTNVGTDIFFKDLYMSASSETSAVNGLLNMPAPMFRLASSTGEAIDSSQLAGQTYVLFFYPKADTPGCTIEACGFRDAIASYQKLDVPVFGISPDPVKEVTKFAKKFDLNFPLLADEDHAVCEAFGVWAEKSMYGKKYMGANRTTFIVGPDGKIIHIFEKVKPDGHDKQVLEYLKMR
jgi:thioredoxin-dependent peroxiredoxin